MPQASPFFSLPETSDTSPFTWSHFSRLTLLSLGPFPKYSLVITRETEHDTRRPVQALLLLQFSFLTQGCSHLPHLGCYLALGHIMLAATRANYGLHRVTPYPFWQPQQAQGQHCRVLSLEVSMMWPETPIMLYLLTR